jgi:thiosulfate dehydrogenase
VAIRTPTSGSRRRLSVWATGAIAALASLIGGLRAQSPAATWTVPDVEALRSDVWKTTLLRGRDLFNETYRFIGPEAAARAPRYAGNNLSCQNCHLQAGTRRFGLPIVGVYGMYPAFMARENEVRTLEDRINGCLERSMNGRAMPSEAPEMRALVAYMQFLSSGVPIGRAVDGRGTPALRLMPRAADPSKGRAVFAEKCASCHQADGLGVRRGRRGDASGYLYPPLWGPDSFNDGAGMHRLIASANFIRANMPFGAQADAPVLSVEDAWDVAAFVNSQPRPARPHLDRDYPDRTLKPVDAPFGPYADAFPTEQHRLGPFQPMLPAPR